MVVIEDYADMVIDPGSVGRDWASVHRWAVALDDGRLIFAKRRRLDVRRLGTLSEPSRRNRSAYFLSDRASKR
ncbi:hypothetical protein [Rhodococcus erythropolis]|uniref:hypothetical protein n=1 Tax=Rhodococcus erythropolis TaxID=1833 RepID=UPI003671437C